MHIYLIIIATVAAYLFKSGKLNFIVKKGLQKAYASLFQTSEDFEDFVKVKENRENIEIESGYYEYKADKGVLDTIDYLDFSINFALSFSKEKKLLKQSIMLTKGGTKHKFTVEGEYNIKGSVVTFVPTEGDLSVLPESLRNSDIKFIAGNDGEHLLISFNTDQFGASALLFEKH